MNKTQVNAVPPEKGDLPFDAVITLESLALQQGVAPIADPSILFGDFWPQEESTDDLLRTLRSWRQNRSITGLR